MKKTAVVTIASENYFAQVQTLLQSLQETNPQWDRFFAVVDNPDEDLYQALTLTDTGLITLEELDIPDLNDMKFRYDIMELNTAIKPFVLLNLLKKYERVIYLDPDIRVYAEMKAVNKAFNEGYHFVLIPHFNDYFEDDGFHPDEPDIMRAGIYNFGFFASDNSTEAIKAIKWWAKRLETLCINKQSEGIFVDQKWGDLLPGRHDKVFILRDHGYNVAYWNLSHRKVSFKDDKYYVNDDELVFFHFSGFDPKQLDNISKHQNRYAMSDIGVAKNLFYEYAKAVVDNNCDEWRKKKYSFASFADGRYICDVFRKLYRENVEVENKVRSSNPFKCSNFFYDEKQWLAPFLINYAFNTHQQMGVYLINTNKNQWIMWFHDVLKNEYKLDNEWIDFATYFLRNHLSRVYKEGKKTFLNRLIYKIMH